MISLFQKKIYKVVKKIPKGKILTYQIVAKKAGYPKAWQAVGNVLNMNSRSYSYNCVTRSKRKQAFAYPSLAIIKKENLIPCHRVIRSDGRVGGYRYGVKRKLSLLKKEGIIIKNRRIVL